MEKIATHGDLIKKLNHKEITKEEYVEEIGKEVDIDMIGLTLDEQLGAALKGSEVIVDADWTGYSNRMTLEVENVGKLGKLNGALLETKLEYVDRLELEFMEMSILKDNFDIRMKRYNLSLERIDG